METSTSLLPAQAKSVDETCSKEKISCMATVIQGILFSRSVRGTFTSLSLVPVMVDRDQCAVDGPPILVRIQFFEHIHELRSFCRRSFKLGDWMEIKGVKWETLHDACEEEISTPWQQPRLVIDVFNPEQIRNNLVVVQSQYWSMSQCQEWQNRYIDRTTKQHRQGSKHTKLQTPPSDVDLAKENCHGGAASKRSQAQHVAKFLVALIMKKNYTREYENDVGMSWLQDPSKWSTWDEQKIYTSKLYKQAIEFLNTGCGVVDVAGGSGHVSMALGMMGVRSTVVDARESVGKLPGRDRKAWNRALQKSLRDGIHTLKIDYCTPVVPFQSCRAWFGHRPIGVDSMFRHPDQDDLPLCDETSDLLKKASAIIALHPDEATGDIVRVAVGQRIPLVIVPCCVFARLFPDRRISTDGTSSERSKVVSTYDDLLIFLQGQDPSLMQSALPFEGKNVALWSNFQSDQNSSLRKKST